MVFPARSVLFSHNILNTKAISHFQANHILIRFVFPPLQGDAYAPPFRIFPTREGEYIEVEIYRGQEKLCTVTQDSELQPLRAAAGKQTDIEIDFRKTEIRAFVKVLPWGEVEQETEM